MPYSILKHGMTAATGVCHLEAGCRYGSTDSRYLLGKCSMTKTNHRGLKTQTCRPPHNDVLACLRCQHLRELWCAACPRIQAINLLHYKKKVYIRPHTTVPRGGRQGRRDPHRWFNIELNYLIKLRGSPTSSLPRYSLAREV